MLSPRRQFLFSAGTLITIGLGGALSACKPRKQGAESEASNVTLTSLVDTIIPTDEFAGAINLGLHLKLIKQTEIKPARKDLLDRLITTVDSLSLRQYKTAFHVLDIERREQLLNNLLSGSHNATAKRDLQRIRNSLLIWYYQSTIGSASVGYLLPAHYPAYTA